jgi:hypothetical protein
MSLKGPICLCRAFRKKLIVGNHSEYLKVLTPF